MKMVKSFFVGLPFLFIGGFLFAGVRFITILVLSVVCTGGLGLLIWIPLSCVIGEFVIRVVLPKKIAKRFNVGADAVDKKGSGDSQSVSKQHRKIEVVAEYIHNGRKNGLTTERIEQNLFDAGWTKEEIQKAKTN